MGARENKNIKKEVNSKRYLDINYMRSVGMRMRCETTLGTKRNDAAPFAKTAINVAMVRDKSV